MSRSVMLGAAISVGVLTTPAQADPLQLSVYKETFPALEAARCSLCHQSDAAGKVRALNEYGMLVHKALGERRTKDRAEIRQALEKVGPAKK